MINNDLISREALKKEFEKVYPLTTNEMGGIVNKRIYDIIDNAPTVVDTERPVVILYGQAIYITQGHIDTMVEYERKEQEKEFIENFMKGLNDERT